MQTTIDLSRQAARLASTLAESYHDRYGAGFMSCTVYDTAWLSLITKPTDAGDVSWLFPECFHYILDTQRDDGGWDAYGSQIDGILNTAASLLALRRHADNLAQVDFVTRDELSGRVSLAKRALDDMLAGWNVPETTHVGFEVIVPTLLRLLEGEDLCFTFEGREALMKIHQAKMSLFRPEYLYGKARSTALHSLEAFIDKIDFEKVAHHKVDGALMASPSSTAAYLMGLPASSWDTEAENYLRHVVNRASACGSVPSAFPSTNFEYLWVLSTLFEAGFTKSDLGPASDRIGDIIQTSFEEGNGVIGFVRSIMADADDTAKGLVVLSRLGRPVPAKGMIEEFEVESHFRTYPLERDSSFSANCNVLLALLHQPEPATYVPQIQKALAFLCDTWWRTDGVIKDKWNLSHLYPSMLMVEALVRALELIDQGVLPSSLVNAELEAKISVAIFQAGVRTMQEQEELGTWCGGEEQTAYAVILLVVASRVGLFQPIQTQLLQAVRRGSDYLTARPSPPGDYIWVEKVTYRSPVLATAYRLAALRLASSVLPEGNESETATVGTCLGIRPTAAQKNSLLQLYGKTPLFAGTPEWELRASLVEGSLFLPLLQARRLDVFPRDGMAEDKYLAVIPFTWTGCNRRSGLGASPGFLYEMMYISLLNYQADEFMEAVAGPTYADDLDALRLIIIQLTADSKASISAPSDLGALEPLRRFVDYVRNHWAVKAASVADSAGVLRELRTFLLAHVQQAEDNTQLASSSTAPNQTFYQWVQTTSADHTSAPYSFAFMRCLVPVTVAPAAVPRSKGSGSSKGRAATAAVAAADCFVTAEEKYYAEAACRHLAVMCRMYNDFGSVARDAAEDNVNSLDFPEFGGGSGGGGTAGATTMAASPKEALFALAEYERAVLMDALGRLEAAATTGNPGLDPLQRRANRRRMACWRVLVDVTDLYGQIYILRDIASRMVPAAGAR